MDEFNSVVFKNKLIELFWEERVLCLLFYWSNAFNRAERKTSDYDFMAVFDSYHEWDIEKIRMLLTYKPLWVTVDFNYQYLEDIERKGWNNYQYDNHWQFYVLNFSESVLLHWSNIFREAISKIDKQRMQSSLLYQIQEYFQRIDTYTMHFQWSNEEIMLFYRKYLTRIIIDMLLFMDKINFMQINIFKPMDIYYTIEKLPSYSHFTKEYYKKLVNSDIDIDGLLALARSAYDDYLVLYETFADVR